MQEDAKYLSFSFIHFYAVLKKIHTILFTDFDISALVFILPILGPLLTLLVA
jgi:hypothetical protein